MRENHDAIHRGGSDVIEQLLDVNLIEVRTVQVARGESDTFGQPGGAELGESAWPIPASGATGACADDVDVGVDSIRAWGGRWRIGRDHGRRWLEGCPFFDGGQASPKKKDHRILTTNSFAKKGRRNFQSPLRLIVYGLGTGKSADRGLD